MSTRGADRRTVAEYLQDRATVPMPLQPHIVYGPVRSRRLGRSLGINLLPPRTKVCNMNCAYCQYGWTREALRPAGPGTRVKGWPTPTQVEAAVTARLARAAASNERLDRLTVAGHGEPTLHPEFEEIVSRLRSVRDRLAPGIRLAVLSNSTTVCWLDVRRALAGFDDRYMKLDAGDPFTFTCVNAYRGSGLSLRHLIDALGALPSIVIQAMFVRDPGGHADNTTAVAVAAWLAAVERISPARVHLYTMNRPPALPALKAVTGRRLGEIAEQVRLAGIHADVFAPRSRGRLRPD
jgi:wyosine [tRNA(Phe)-imidazoG37] synthetase (radical SAM superfamily)